MKKPVMLTIKRIGALMAAAALGIMAVPMHSQAMEHRSYTYIYDYIIFRSNIVLNGIALIKSKKK